MTKMTKNDKNDKNDKKMTKENKKFKFNNKGIYRIIYTQIQEIVVLQQIFCPDDSSCLKQQPKK